MSDHENQLRQQLARKTGLAPALLEQPSVVSFVRQRCHQLGLSDVRGYLDLLEHRADELDLLVHEVAVAETWLFRYPASYQLLFEHLRGRLQHASAAGLLRMLSVACATGEEAYSMAITAAAAGWPWTRIIIDAIDRQERSLAVARRGTYSGRALRETHPDWAEPWLQRSRDTLQVDCRAMAAVNFMGGDALSDSFAPPAKTYDVVFCRNLLIYLNPKARERLADRLATWLRADGLLFVGHAEHVAVFRPRFSPVAVPHTFALRLVSSVDDSRQTGPAPQGLSGNRLENAKTESTRLPLDQPLSHPSRGRRPKGHRHSHSKTGSQNWPLRVEPTRVGREPHRENDVPATTESPAQEPMRTLQHAQHQADNGDLRQALATLQELLASDLADPGVYELLGNVYLGLEQIDQARAAFERVIYLLPDHPEALLQMALICQRQGDTQQAARYRQRAARSQGHEELG